MSAITVMLGDHEIEVPEQRIGRLTNKTADLFSDAFGSLAEFDGTQDSANVGADLAKVGREKFCDERPNFTVARGVTLPRLRLLVESYQARRKRELRQLGLVVNRAVNGGDDFDAVLDQMFPAPGDEEPSVMAGEKWWD